MSKNISNPAEFLTDSGLLFEINRTVLHPLGLALAVFVPSKGEIGKIEIHDIRDEDPEGWVFEDPDFVTYKAKLEKFVKDTQVQTRLMARRASLGYIVQGEEEPPFSVMPGPDRG